MELDKSISMFGSEKDFSASVVVGGAPVSTTNPALYMPEPAVRRASGKKLTSSGTKKKAVTVSNTTGMFKKQ